MWHGTEALQAEPQRVVRRFSAAWRGKEKTFPPLRSQTSAAETNKLATQERGPEGPHYPTGDLPPTLPNSSTAFRGLVGSSSCLKNTKASRPSASTRSARAAILFKSSGE